MPAPGGSRAAGPARADLSRVMLRHLLFVTDLSLASQAVWDAVQDLVRANGTRVTLLHLYELPGTGLVRMYNLAYTPALRRLEASITARALARLEALQQELADSGITVETCLVQGFAGDRIVESAQARACDLIVLGRRGLGPLSDLLLDSISTHVLKHSPCPVLVLPARSAVAAPAAGPAG